MEFYIKSIQNQLICTVDYLSMGSITGQNSEEYYFLNYDSNIVIVFTCITIEMKRIFTSFHRYKRIKDKGGFMDTLFCEMQAMECVSPGNAKRIRKFDLLQSVEKATVSLIGRKMGRYSYPKGSFDS